MQSENAARRTATARSRWVARLTAASLAALLLVGGVAVAPAQAAVEVEGEAAGEAAAPAGLSVTITDGSDEVTSNTGVTYTAELTNAGSEPVTATLVITVPPFATLKAAEGGEIAAPAATDATWTVTVDPGASASVTASATIGAIPAPGRCGSPRWSASISVRVSTRLRPHRRSDRRTPT